jgi:viroplasmin and RNaseH domain-containing protein
MHHSTSKQSKQMNDQGITTVTQKRKKKGTGIGPQLSCESGNNKTKNSSLTNKKWINNHSSAQSKSFNKMITGHVLTNENNVKDVIIYNILTKWSHEKLLNELMLWGKMISASIKTQKKYYTVQLKIELNLFALATFN